MEKNIVNLIITLLVSGLLTLTTVFYFKDEHFGIKNKILFIIITIILILSNIIFIICFLISVFALIKNLKNKNKLIENSSIAKLTRGLLQNGRLFLILCFV